MAQMPSSLYEEWRKSPYPAKDVVLKSNPTPLLWPSVKHWENRDVRYNVYLSQDPAFPEAATQGNKNQRACFYNPHRPLKEGKWYWKYEIVSEGKTVSQPVCSFIVPKDAEGLSSPTPDEFRKHIPSAHPRVMNYGRPIDEIRARSIKHPLYKRIIADALTAAGKDIYRGAVTDENPATARRLTQKANKEVELYHTLLEGYTLKPDAAVKNALLQRTDVLLTWPTNDLLGSKVLTALAVGYDMLFDELSADVKGEILAAIDSQLNEGLSRWPGHIETRQVENHFWQMELAGNFTAALATVGELASAGEMLDYTYGLFMARFPNLATQDGGWNEGEGYYSVNQTAIVDMALLLKRIGGIDIFQMPWYRRLTDYFTYFSPVGAPVSGFGDMHERVATGSLKGRSETLVIGCEEKDPYALYRLFASLRPDGSFYGAPLSDDYWKKPLSKIEPWYQIVNDVQLAPEMAHCPNTLPHDKVFYGVGTAAMHTRLDKPAEDVAVYFRSSPFGSKGHAHADQNSFNIARRGERLFYSTGYYTSFADKHSLTSYKHTRASNSILINGCGQAFGHEGYGWIKRHIEGEHLSYVCGDASQAYKRTTDKQFSDFLAQYGIEQAPSFGMGDTPMKKFERHLVFVRPDVVVLYDVLEADSASQWTLLLHSMKPSSVSKDNVLSLQTSKSQAEAHVFGSTPIKGTVTNRFFAPADDFKQKYKDGTPDQYHATFSTTENTGRMRFLTIICMADKDAKAIAVKSLGKGKWKVGKIDIQAEMDASKPAALSVKYGSECLTTGPAASQLTGKGKSIACEDTWPEGNYAY